MGWTDAELSVLLTDDAEIRELNAQYRDVDAPTDVLSFPLDDLTAGDGGPPESGEPGGPGWPAALGDVVISVPTAARQAAEAQHRERLGRDGPWTLDDEVLFLLVHGVLHLLGHDHAVPAEEARMRVVERKLFELLAGRPAASPS